jgi:TldD protein
MRDFLHHGVDAALIAGASYADMRIIDLRSETINMRNGRLARLDQSETLGYGIRVIANGSWGFASGESMSLQDIEKVAKQAVAIAKASALVQEAHVRLAYEEPAVDVWQTPVAIDPFTVPLERKIALLEQADALMRKDERIKVAQGSLSFEKIHKWFSSSEGALIEQVQIISGGGIDATAVGKGDTQTRSYPASFRGQYKSMGYELILALDLIGHAERVRDEAVALLTAPVCPQGERDLILHGNQMTLQIHESVGHASELDRVLGHEANYAGTSFATTDKLGSFRYGAEIVNLVADSTVPTGLATFGYDDDGVAAQRWHIVKDGILSGYMTNRELAHVIGKERSYGANRADGYQNVPIVRIANLSLMPGDWELPDLLADSDGALFFDCNNSWSIDQRRLNFQFGCEVAWEIKGGKRTTMYKNPTYQGIAPQFWASCDAICNHNYWDLWGVINCGKGQPGQRAIMSHGSAPTRFRKVTVGVR